MQTDISKTIMPLSNVDRELLDITSKYASEEFWSFKQSSRKHTHAFYQYPAMMVPEVQGTIVDLIMQLQKSVNNILDPFVGSGTIMTEAMLRGLNFTGQDINPLAILICKTKKGPFLEHELIDSYRRIVSKFNNDSSDEISIYFPGLTKWFKSHVAIVLSKIRRAIQAEEQLWVRRFFWVVLAEVVRLTSNSRTSTYKLHIRSEANLNRNISPISLFQEVAERNIKELSGQKELMIKRGILSHGKYPGDVKIFLQDSSQKIIKLNPNQCYDLVITSPPYGDNNTTIPYGQSAFLPLQWIDLNDIDSKVDNSCLSSTLEIDTRSLGGKRENWTEKQLLMTYISPSFSDFITKIDNTSNANKSKVTAFISDLYNAIVSIAINVRQNGYIVMTVGNRRVANVEVPLDQIIIDYMDTLGIGIVTKLKRNIYSKKMAVRNNFTTTMKYETILIFRKL